MTQDEEPPLSAAMIACLTIKLSARDHERLSEWRNVPTTSSSAWTAASPSILIELKLGF